MKRRFNIHALIYILIPAAAYLLLQRLSAMILELLRNIYPVSQLFYGSDSVYVLGFASTAMAAIIGIPVFIRMLDSDELIYPSEVKYEHTSAVNYFYLVPMAILLASAMNQLIVLTRIDEIFTSYKETGTVLYSGGLYMGLLVLGIIIPITEELIFRGVIYGRLLQFFDVRSSMILISLFFGIYHGGITQGIYTFCIGLVIVYMRDKYKDLKAAIIMHMCCNIYSVFATETAVFNWTYESPAMLISTMIISFALCAVIIWRIEEKVMPKRVKKDFMWHNSSDL